MTTAAADVTTPTEEITPPAGIAPEAVEQVAPPPEGEQAAPVETPAAEAVTPTEFTLDTARQAAVAEAFGTPVDAPPSTPEPELPGQSLDDVALATFSRLGTEYSQLMQTFEAREIQPFLRDELGLEPREAQQVYEKVRPWLAHQHSRNEAYNLTVTDQVLRSLLTPEEVEEYSSRSYLIKDNAGNIQPLNSRAAALKAVLTLREKAVNADWHGKLEKGDLLTKAEAIKKADLAVATYSAALEKAGRLSGTSSGVSVNGDSATSGGWHTKTEARNLHVQDKISNAEMRRINSDPTIPE